MSKPPESVICVECGGTAHLISFLPEDEPVEPGTTLAYRCADCGERTDIVWEDDLD
jgi:DNA-directed RNA polymerase subunit RPC12/RpoP